MVTKNYFAKSGFEKFFEFVENIIYLFIAVFLIITAVILLYMIGDSFFHAFTDEDLMEVIVSVLDNILLVLMVIEIIYTIRVSLKEHTLSPEPFLIVGLIASIRRILIISVESAHLVDRPEFSNYMLEMGILGGLTLIFVISIFLIEKQKTVNNKKQST